MKKFTRLLLLVFCLHFFKPIHAQDTPRLRISLLTCTPGDELYSIFGHSAIRVIDSNSLSDIVYNYGTFDFYDPDFYIKFMQGKLLYFLSTQKTSDFILDYQYMRRGITEQILDLTANEKLFIHDSLLSNLQEANKFYKYDFFYDNCTTRLRDLILIALHRQQSFPAVMPLTMSFRDAIHQYLDSGRQYWSKLGIDLLLGLPTDKIMTPSEQDFLPDNLMGSMDKENKINLIRKKEIIYTAPSNTIESSIWQPGITLTLFSLFWLGLSFLFSRTKKLRQLPDRILFLIIGLLGTLLLFMWVGTDHIMTIKNMNLLWAWPLNLIIAFIPGYHHPLMKKYFRIQFLILSTVVIAWFILPQQLHAALIAPVILLAYRCFTLSSNN